MIKTLAFLTRKPGMSREAFIERYETQHAPLGVRVMPTAKRYIRRYVKPVGEGYPVPDFDVITEAWFEDTTAYTRAMDALMKPDTAALIAEDEEQQFDRSKMHFAVVEEHETQLANEHDAGDVKFLAFMARKQGMSTEDFTRYYENNHAPFAVQYIDLATRYFRRFLRPSVFQNDESEGMPNFHVMTEVCFASLEDMRTTHALVAKPEIAALFAKDEENLFDRSNMTFALADEYESQF
jgi:EthD domain